MDSNRPPAAPGMNQGQPQGHSPAGGPSTGPAVPARPAAPGIILPGNPTQSGSAAPTPMAPNRPAAPPRIQHTKPGIGLGQGGAGTNSGATSAMEEALRPINRINDEARPLPVADASGLAGGGAKITAFGGKSKRHEDEWSRSPNTTGSGAIHVKTFHCKLTDDALLYLDQAINEWLDAHPQYEVKFVSTAVGIMTGKLKEPAMICQVWV